MKDFGNWLMVFGGLSGESLAALVMLGAFALAGFAIYAVLAVTKGGR